MGILAGLILLLAAFDCQFSLRHLESLGSEGELNSLARWAHRKFGPNGFIIAVMGTSILQVLTLGLFNAFWAAWFLLGVRTNLALIQLAALLRGEASPPSSSLTPRV
jgi:hypothetical protein